MTNSEKLLKVLGGDPNAYATNYGVRKAILSALGGNPESCSNINEVDLEILRIYQEGGGGTGGTVVLETANITKNGTYVPSEGYNGFDKAIVNVVPVLETANITKNGTYTPSSNYDGFGSVVVNVPTGGDGTVKVLDGMKFGISTVLPENLDTSDVTNFASMFYDCNKLTTIPLIDTSNGTNFYNIFYKCSSLTTIPLIDTSNGTRFSYMFSYCSSLTSVPLIDTSNGTEFDFMFHNCSNLTSIPVIDTSNGTSFGSMFGSCSKLTTVPQLNTSKGINFSSMFSNCSILTTIPPLDTSKGTNFNYMFGSCKKLTTITFTGCINYNIDFSPCTLLTYDSVKSILTACSNTTRPTSSKTLKFSRTLTDQNGELAALVADCNTKGWTISGLTLN